MQNGTLPSWKGMKQVDKCGVEKWTGMFVFGRCSADVIWMAERVLKLTMVLHKNPLLPSGEADSHHIEYVNDVYRWLGGQEGTWRTRGGAGAKFVYISQWKRALRTYICTESVLTHLTVFKYWINLRSRHQSVTVFVHAGIYSTADWPHKYFYTLTGPQQGRQPGLESANTQSYATATCNHFL